MSEDKKKLVGSRISAKAIHITNLAECTRRYGCFKKTKIVYGTVLEHISTQKNKNSTRITNMIVGDFDLGGGFMKRASLHLRSVNLVLPVHRPPQQQKIAETAPTFLNPPEDDDTVIEAEVIGGPIKRSCLDVSLLKGVDIEKEKLVNVERDTTEADMEEFFVPSKLPEPELLEPEEERGERPVVIVHGTKWFNDDRGTLRTLNSRHCNPSGFKMEDAMGNIFRKGDDKGQRFSRLEYFLMMFPPTQLQNMIRLSNISLLKANEKVTTKGELLKLIGVMILVSKFEFTSRANLWSNTAPSKYIPAPSFGKTGMSRPRFDVLMRHLVYSEQPPERPYCMCHETYRWLLVDDFVEEFNNHRKNFFNQVISFVLMSQFRAGMVRGEHGLTMVCQCMWPLTENQTMVVKYKIRVVGAAVS